MLIASLKLRRRNLGPLLDANGWAVNARVVNIPFGASLTQLAELPPGARALAEPSRRLRASRSLAVAARARRSVAGCRSWFARRPAGIPRMAPRLLRLRRAPSSATAAVATCSSSSWPARARSPDRQAEARRAVQAAHQRGRRHLQGRGVHACRPGAVPKTRSPSSCNGDMGPETAPKVLLVPLGDTYLAQVTPAARRARRRRLRGLAQAPRGLIAFKVKLRDETTWQEWIDEPVPESCASSTAPTASSCRRTWASCPARPERPLGAGARRPHGSADPAQGLRAREAAASSDAPDVCFVPSMGIAMADVISAFAANYLRPTSPSSTSSASSTRARQPRAGLTRLRPSRTARDRTIASHASASRRLAAPAGTRTSRARSSLPSDTLHTRMKSSPWW